MGPLSRDEWITLLVFAGVGLTWLTTVFHGLDVTMVALIGLGVLLVTGTHAAGRRRRASGRRGTCSCGTAACCAWASC